MGVNITPIHPLSGPRMRWGSRKKIPERGWEKIPIGFGGFVVGEIIYIRVEGGPRNVQRKNREMGGFHRMRIDESAYKLNIISNANKKYTRESYDITLY